MAIAVQLFEHASALATGVASNITTATISAQAYLFAEPVDISGDGHAIDFAWNGVAGATSAELVDASVTLYPAMAETVMPDKPATADGGGWRVDVPSGARVRAIGLKGFKGGEGNEIVDAPPADQRIAIAFPPPRGGGFDSPRFSVPPVWSQGAVPATLTGAALASRTITLNPSVAATRVRIMLVSGPNPPEFSAQTSTLDALQLITHTPARNAKLTGPDGQALWSVPAFDPDAGSTQVDLRQSLQAEFNRLLKTGEPLQASLKLRADAPARCSVFSARAHGALLRVHDGIATTALEGDALPLAVFDGAALADETPSSAIGDLTIHYDGLRVLEEVSDAPPDPTSPVMGRIVGITGATRAWPPEALLGREPARIGVYGRAPEACELALELVELNGEIVGATLAGPALLQLDAAAGLRTHWAELPPSAALPRNVGLRLRCNVGRFFWAERPDGVAIVRVAIRDPDPGGRPLMLGNVKIADVTGAESHQPAFSFPASAFRGHVPFLQSSLFLHVDCSDLTLRYAR
ncbi:hypothetical protein QTI66_00975 [Variovorax sp. J22R133]|uniref:hypothetical protein n=1 Tax=Variovorax brevis TaxID=3053503 RepID=UPI00257847F6|nr:hypothetical protein [Variovorax sp. J22R133]MDM0110698.1 hypothetical protein [Variovorax sp. J22R133]